jgi:predicted membrane-bound mannosyltransferase
VLVLLAGVCALLGTVARAFTVSAWHTLGITVPLLVLVAVIIAVRVANGRDSRNRRRRIRAADREPPGRMRGQAAGLPDGSSVEEDLAVLRAQLWAQRQARERGR